ncbi:MAG TPA: MarR family transcriptional regulator [Allosphingosinicella sp.]
MLEDRDYKVLASVRAELRSFAHFTEKVTSGAGLTPQQHQILLALRASDELELTIGQLAETMFLKPHSVSGMADRLAGLGLVERVRSEEDRRSIRLRLTDKAREVLASLGQAHKDELRRIRPLLISLLSQLD